MLVDEAPRSFIMKNNNYSHCPLKKRPVHVLLNEDVVPSPVKEEPENLSTKPEDLSKRSFSPIQQQPIIPIVHPPPVAKKGRIEVIQHENNSIVTNKIPLESLNLNTPIEPLNHYSNWQRSTAPIYPPHYLPYPASYRYHHPGSELYTPYPMPAYPEHQELQLPGPGATTTTTLTCPTIQRPIARSYIGWPSSPDHCGLSPTSSLGSSSLRSPPPIITAEDLSSPGSDSGRSSAGSTSTGPIKTDNKTTTTTTTTTTSPRYQCPDCGKSYSTYSGLSKHQQFHCAAAEGQLKKSFSCKYCEKVYVSLGALKMHIRTHTLPCKCHLCGKAFSRPWLLQGHIRTHTGEKPFSCQHCNRAFADRSNLRAHLQTHSDVKKYSCSSCSKTFSRMSLLSKHQESGCPGISVGYNC